MGRRWFARNWNDDSPKWMNAKKAGTCDWCGKSFPQGEFIAYSLGKCWHQECHAKRHEPKPLTCAECGKTIDPGEQFRIENHGLTYHPGCYKEPEPEPEPTAPAWLRLDMQWGILKYSEYCDGLITLDGNAVFLSVFGSDSRIKGITSCFLDAKQNSRSRHGKEGLSYQLPTKRYTDKVLRVPGGDYRRLTTKLGNHAHQICAVEQFFSDGPSLEHDFHYLLFDPRTQDPASITVDYIVNSLPVPYLPTWRETIFAQLRENADADPSLAHCQILEPIIGTHQAVRIRVTEKSMDTLISDLVKQGKIEF